MTLRSLIVVLALTLALAGVGCNGEAPPEEVHEDVRAEYLGVVGDGESIVIDHEAVPDFMDAMLMTVPLEDEEGAEGLEEGDPIAFDFLVNGSDIRVDNVEALPDTVELDLAEPDEEQRQQMEGTN